MNSSEPGKLSSGRKRRALLMAGLIVCAILVLVVPYWWTIWLAVAYEPHFDKFGDRYYVKQLLSGPGAEFYIPPQTCYRCRLGEHEGCDRTVYCVAPGIVYSEHNESQCVCPTCQR